MRTRWLLTAALVALPWAAYAQDGAPDEAKPVLVETPPKGPDKYQFATAGLIAVWNDAKAALAEGTDCHSTQYGRKVVRRFDCVDFSKIPNSALLHPDEVHYHVSEAGLLVTLPGSDDPLKVLWALGPTSMLDVDTLSSRNLTALEGAAPKLLLGVRVGAGAKAIVVKELFHAPGPWSRESCKVAAQLGKVDKDVPLVCVDIVDGERVISTPKNNVLAPNKTLVVVVRYREGERVAVELGGERGITDRVITPSTSKDKSRGDDDKDAARTPGIRFSVTRFAPRKVGSADLTVKKVGAGGESTVKVEFEVEQLYWGAARFGLATLVGDFREYDTITLAGSDTMQVRESHVPLQFELVTGFAAYPEALFGTGRRYVNGDNYHVAPFVGVGLLGESGGGLSALNSVHVGIDIEFARDFSLVATFALRRTDVLSSGYSPGSPVNADAVFTEKGVAMGGALILTATPRFLQFQTGDTQEGK